MATKIYGNATQGSNGGWYIEDPESGDRIGVIPWTSYDEDGNPISGYVKPGSDPDKAAAMNLMAFNAARDAAQAPVNWTQDLPLNLAGYGVTLNPETARAGDTVPVSTVADIANYGLSSSASPLERTDLRQFLDQTGMTLQQYQDQYQAQPYKFNDDGTAIYDPALAVNNFEYTPADWERQAQIGIGGILALATAGLALGAMGGVGAGAGAGGAGAATGAGSTLGGLADFSLAGAGTGIGGVGTAGLGLNTAALGLTPELVAAGGGAGALGIGSGLGLALPTATGAIADTAAALAAQGGVSLPAASLPSSGSFTGSIDLPSVSNPLQLPTDSAANTTPSAVNTDLSLAQPGQGYGGVGTGGQGLSLGANSTGGAIGTTAADLAAQAGVTLPEITGVGAGTGAGLGLNLPAGGLIDQTAASLAAQGGVSLPTATGVGSGIGSGTSVPTSTAATTAATTAANGASTASSLSRLLNGEGTLDDWLKVGGILGSSALGAYSSNQQADAIKDEAARLDAIQAPWRQKLSDMYANPTGFLTSAPVQTSLDEGTKSVARALSTQWGNPAVQPGALAEINKYAANSLYGKFGEEANRLAAFGGMNYPATASSTLNVQGSQAGNGVYDALGYGLGQLTAPKQTTVADLLKALNSGNLFSQTVAA